MRTGNDKKTLMKKHGITCEQKFVYRYKQYQYDNLQNAINFAKLDNDDGQVNRLSDPENISANTSSGKSEP